jgi:hypothetical protein
MQEALTKFVFQDNLEKAGNKVSEIIVHPDWDVLTKSFEADIAIAILKETVEFSLNVTNICLNSSTKPVEDFFVGQNATVCDWKITEPSENETTVELKVVTVPIVDRDKCKESTVLREIYSDTLFCAGNIDIASGLCKGMKRHILPR